MILYLFINSREASRKACEICMKLRLHKDMATFQTLHTFIGHNAMPYHNSNALPHVLPYIFSEICLVCFGLLATRYQMLPSFLKKDINIYIYIYIYINFTVTLGHSSQIAPNHPKLKKNVW